MGDRAKRRPGPPPVPRVYLTAGDRLQWAIDEDLRLIRLALGGVAEITTRRRCETVLAPWWEPLVSMLPHELAGKQILCHMTGDLSRYLEVERFAEALRCVGLWIARSRRGAEQLAEAGLPHVLIPYTVDPEIFRPLARTDLHSVRERWGIPVDRFLIGSFQRDTQGADLASPKLVKGPDLFFELICSLRDQGVPAHAVLAGPRRHWLRNRLADARIPFTFCGVPHEGDDLAINTLDRSELNDLYNLLDLYVVSSRSEGGPHAILEAAASRCPILSRPVGIAEDVLQPRCLFDTPREGASMAFEHHANRRLDETLDSNQKAVQERFVPERVRGLYREALSRDLPRYRPAWTKRMRSRATQVFRIGRRR